MEGMEGMEKGLNLRQSMPNVARLVDEQRTAHGAAFVNGCIKRGIAGEPDQFYAFEAGHVLGTPFKADALVAKCVLLTVVMGGKFAMVIATPTEAASGAH